MGADRAAAYCDMSRTKFLDLVQGGHMPSPKEIDGMARWDRRDLDAAVDAMSDRNRKRAAGRRKTLDDLWGAEDGDGETAVR
jgi:predicted DNA-binding transcriptional regulator AlpA